MSNLLYKSECWTISLRVKKKKLEAAEIWFYRSILKIPWIEWVSNKKVFKMPTERTLRNWKPQLKFGEHIMKKSGLNLMWHIEGNYDKGRQQATYLMSVWMDGRMGGGRGVLAKVLKLLKAIHEVLESYDHRWVQTTLKQQKFTLICTQPPESICH